MRKLALEKDGYKPSITGTTKVKVGVDEEGYISPTGTTPTSQKTMSITRVSAENSLKDNTDVLNFFITLANGVQDSLTNTMQVKWEV